MILPTKLSFFPIEMQSKFYPFISSWRSFKWNIWQCISPGEECANTRYSFQMDLWPLTGDVKIIFKKKLAKFIRQDFVCVYESYSFRKKKSWLHWVGCRFRLKGNVKERSEASWKGLEYTCSLFLPSCSMCHHDCPLSLEHSNVLFFPFIFSPGLIILK